jgi:D-alanyl-D-alanine carboxypeptidase
VQAKTGTLKDISALSGWVWLRRKHAWAEFSIMSSGMPKYVAAPMEDRIVRILTRSGR